MNLCTVVIPFQPRIGKESEHIFVDLSGIGRAHPVWEPGIDLERGVLYQLCRQEGRVCNGDDLIIIAVKMSVGTSIFLRSSVKSVSENALMQS